MSAEGSVSVSVDFNDTASSESLDVLKKIRLATNNAYSGQKAVVLSGTCGTTAATFELLAPGYTDASGFAVTFAAEGNVTGIAVYSDTKVTFTLSPTATGNILPAGRSMKLASQGYVAVSGMPAHGTTLGGSTCSIFTDDTTEKTATYTVVLWGT